MNHNLFCPRCQNEIPKERQLYGLTVCECGWTSSHLGALNDRRMTDKVCMSIVGVALLLIAAFIHTVNWDNYSIVIIPLKVKQLTQSASAADLKEIAKICDARLKYACVMDAHAQRAQLFPEENEAWAELGILYSNQGYTEEAAESLGHYFKQGGKDPKAAYEYAKALGQLGQVKESSKWFKYVLKAKPGMLQISVTRSYVDMLVKHKKLKVARRVLKNYRRKGGSDYVLEREWKTVNKRLRLGS